MAISSPGKVLMLGGYAILNYYPGLSVALESKEGEGVVAHARLGERRIISKDFDIDVEPSENGEGVEVAYLLAERFLSAYGAQPVHIELKNSEIFGSKDEKSGLGSSSASIVSTVSAYFYANGFRLEENKEAIHAISQVANAIHSKKTGSGYDIASACYGTIEYVRFPPSVIEEVGFDNIRKVLSKDWGPMRINGVKLPWDVAVYNIKNRKTSTVRAVEAFKKAKKERPTDVEKALLEQSRAERSAFDALRREDQDAFREAVRQARKAHLKLSSIMKEIAPEAEEIEPLPLRELIKKAESLDGVVAGRCHGAGGWDGVAFFVEKGFDVRSICEISERMGISLEALEVKVNEEGVHEI